LKEPFRDITDPCLRRHPDSRWNVTQIAARLEGRASAPQARSLPSVSPAQVPAAQPIAQRPSPSTKRDSSFAAFAVGFALILAVILAGSQLLRRKAAAPKVPAVAEVRPPVTRKENHATRMATLVVPSAANNRKRHERLQRFMLINDSVTVAVEVPVFLTRDDLAYHQQCGFDLNFRSEAITGHIDFLQIRNGYIHILDYKPEAHKETHAHVQLTIYALALARRTALPVKLFKCGWFDEKDYFEFFPLQGVFKRRS